MTESLRSHASVRSYYFRERLSALGPDLEDYRASDFRPLWRKADRQAREWRRLTTTCWNHTAQAWEQRI